jgi:cytochrome b
MDRQSSSVRVWDPLVRISHWALVVLVGLAFFTAEKWPETHEAIGYTVGAIVVVRILWGLIGSGHARFSDFVYGPSKVVSYFREMLAFRGRRYLGHSPAGGAMVVALLLTVAAIVGTGIIAEQQAETSATAPAVSASQSPAETLVTRDNGNREQVSLAGEIHEALTNFLFFLVALHFAGVLFASYAHHENLVWAMITGRKQAKKPTVESEHKLHT